MLDRLLRPFIRFRSQRVPNFGTVVPNVGPIVPSFGRVVPNVGPFVPNFGPVVPNVGPLVPNFGMSVPSFGMRVPNNGRARPPGPPTSICSVTVFSPRGSALRPLSSLLTWPEPPAPEKGLRDSGPHASPEVRPSSKWPEPPAPRSSAVLRAPTPHPDRLRNTNHKKHEISRMDSKGGAHPRQSAFH